MMTEGEMLRKRAARRSRKLAAWLTDLERASLRRSTSPKGDAFWYEEEVRAARRVGETAGECLALRLLAAELEPERVSYRYDRTPWRTSRSEAKRRPVVEFRR